MAEADSDGRRYRCAAEPLSRPMPVEAMPMAADADARGTGASPWPLEDPCRWRRRFRRSLTAVPEPAHAAARRRVARLLPRRPAAPAPAPAPAPARCPAAAAPAASSPAAATLPPGAQPTPGRPCAARSGTSSTPSSKGLNFIGRADEKPVDIDLEDQEPPDRVWCSRQHACIHFEDGQLSIEDLNSANGTFVNRTRIYPGTKRPLNVNDVIQIGNVQMKVVV